MEIDDITSFCSGVEKAYTFYRCGNGHVYSINNCGDPLQKERCPECKEVIGKLFPAFHVDFHLLRIRHYICKSLFCAHCLFRVNRVYDISNLLEVFDDILDILDKDASVDILQFDFSKAFDTVTHFRLLSKLEC